MQNNFSVYTPKYTPRCIVLEEYAAHSPYCNFAGV